MRHIQTKYAFTRMLRALDCDLILDVGSRDAQESLIFSAACPAARVIALEANPHNAARIRANSDVSAAGIELQEIAAWNAAGSVTFHVTRCDHADPRSNIGTSGIKAHLDLPQDAITVEAVPLADLICREAPNARRIALWIDVEGAEAEVIEGLAPVMEHVVVIHVETATKAMHADQRLLGDLDAALERVGMRQIGGHMDGGHWGDVLYVNEACSRRSYARHLVTAQALALFPRRKLATAIWKYAPRLHASLKNTFGRNVILSGY